MTKNNVLSLFGMIALLSAALLYVLGMSAVNHGNGVFAGLMWLFWGAAALFALILVLLPLFIWRFYPSAGLAGAGAAAAVAADPGPPLDMPASADADEDDEEFSDAPEDDGEQLFGDEDFEDDFEDDFDGDFADDDKF
ncbi:MAG: hypothetical protein R3C20_19360 [Planctomycetaceae bacterium]